ncbi:hypothetical protein [Arthrobacter dokdonensis]|uniref:hypothetical protein n=1 Tax=Arthrobacter dokdonellae TaxID=2211210 RepID=UPI001D131AA6|nr:hypothetical protein [Arthrobacter dokdonellae]
MEGPWGPAGGWSACDWERTARTTPFPARTARTGQEQWLQVPVGVRSQPWGRLVVPTNTRDDELAATVLERAAQTLATNRLADRDQRELTHRAQAGLQQFAESELAGILDAEAKGRDGLLDLLGHYLESGGNKAALARNGYVSRPTTLRPAREAGGAARRRPGRRRIPHLPPRGPTPAPPAE